METSSRNVITLARSFSVRQVSASFLSFFQVSEQYL